MKVLWIIAVLLLPGQVASQDSPPLFSQDVAPIMERHCNHCHSGWFPKAGVDLGSLASIKKGSRAGPLVVPGQPDKGWLMFSLTQATGPKRMPPDGPGLSDIELSVLRGWIASGAN